MHNLGTNVRGKCLHVSVGEETWWHSERKEGEKEPNVRMSEAVEETGGSHAL